jgi:hypothetical protein
MPLEYVPGAMIGPAPGARAAINHPAKAGVSPEPAAQVLFSKRRIG